MVRTTPAARRSEGFTLVELLIIVIVLGLLAAIVVYAIGDTRSTALESTCRATANSVELAAEAYHTKNDVYPAADEDVKLADQALGGLLKSWPVETSPDYRLDWNGTAVQVFDTNASPEILTGVGEAGCAGLP